MNPVNDEYTDEESISSDSDMATDLFDEIYEYEQPDDAEKVDSSYSIGIYHLSLDQTDMIMASTVSATTFHAYQCDELLYYLSNYSYTYIQNPVLHIMQLKIQPDYTYSVVLKTHWLRLIQRNWKRVYKLRHHRMMSQIHSTKDQVCTRELEKPLPQLRGMLHHLNVNKYKN
jgi:hypothetical protein